MAANIEERNGRYSFVENGSEERAWHRLGMVYDRPLTVVEAIEGCRANFEVGLQPVIAADPKLETMLNGSLALDSENTKIVDGKQFVSVDMLRNLIIEGRKATMRYDLNTPLAIVSDAYGVVQYQKAFEFVDVLTSGKLGGETPVIESAGLLGSNGERLFITAKFPESIRLSHKDDTIDQYIVFTTSHDGTGAVTAMVTPVRVVCENTLRYSLSHNSGKISFRHTSGVNNRIDLLNKENAELAYKTLKLYNTYKEYFEADLQALAAVRLGEKQQEIMMAQAVFTPDVFKVYKDNNYNVNTDDISTKSKNILNGAMEAVQSGIGQDMLENGTGLKLINGLTCFYQNIAGWNGDEERKFNSIMDGNVQKKVQALHDLILKAA